MCSGWLSIRRFRALDMPAQPDPKRPRRYQASSPDSVTGGNLNPGASEASTPCNAATKAS